MIAVLIVMNLALALLKKGQSASATTFFISSVYVYCGVFLLNDKELYSYFTYVVFFHFVVAIIVPRLPKINTLKPLNNKKLNFALDALVLIYLFILIFNLDISNIELSRMKTFQEFKILYYNLLIMWPVLFLLREKVSKPMVLAYLLTSILTGFRSLIINFIFLIALKSVFKNNSLSDLKKLILPTLLLLAVIVAVSYFRTTAEQKSLFTLVVDRVFMVNAENINTIVGKDYNFGFTQIFRDFAPLRLFFLELNLTTAEYITKDLNHYFFSTGRIMTPTMFGLGYSSLGSIGFFTPIILIGLFDTFVFIYERVVKRPISAVWVFISISMVTRGVWSVLGLYAILAIPIVLISIYKIKKYDFRYNS